MAAISPIRPMREAKARGAFLAMISLYDAPSATLCCDAGVDCLLVGDSLGNVVLGYDDFLSVTMEDLLRHTAAVGRGAKKSSRPQVPVIADLPFSSYTSAEQAARNGAALMRAGAHGLKLEGAGPIALRAVRTLVEIGAPVVGHLGFTPQSALHFSGVVQAKTGEAAARLLREARSLEEAGCFALVLEAVPQEVARRITEALSIPTIGIGAGAGCDGQVLVWHDLAGITPGPPLRFVKRYADADALLRRAAQDFVDEVHSGAFPAEEHGWSMPEAELEGWRTRDEG
jgi:3-methyl-2-oxobutanoate hydroxymethyltransferase